MKIISHRGFWLKPHEKNTECAFRRSFELGLGTETDIRDCMGQLVISHDLPLGKEQGLNNFLLAAKDFSDKQDRLTIALNIKSDGMAEKISDQLSKFPELDCFVFDMAIPDMRLYIENRVPVFTRMSEVERSPCFLDQAMGVWLDAFEVEWYGNEIIENLINIGKRVCIVSSELHGRSPDNLWRNIRESHFTDQVILCTDNPRAAIKYFQEDFR